MYFKIAAKNVKKSFKDYAIYFLTLALSVCIFYSFNSMGEQKIFLDMNSVDTSYSESVKMIISIISIFVSFILGSLILYANNFIVKKRNKELGIYMILGMSKRKVSNILIIETFIIGIVSLVIGLLIGMVASQGLSMFIANLFQVSMNQYEFIFSIESMLKTILYFGIMFLLVIVFNSAVISKYKIIELLTSYKKNEKIKFRNPIIYFITFILCIICLSVAYNFIFESGLNVEDKKFIASIVLGVFGTFLFFFSFSGFILFVSKKIKQIYFNKLNIFVINQIKSKINTNFISMSVICLMIFVAISVLSTGVSYKNALESSLKKSTVFDASAVLYLDEENIPVEDVEKSIKNTGFKFNHGEEYAKLNSYVNGSTIGELFNSEDIDKDYTKYKVNYIAISEYNKTLELLGKNPITLNDNEVVLTSSNDKLIKSIKEYLKDNSTIDFSGKGFEVKDKNILEDNLQTGYTASNIITVVANDEYIQNFKLDSSSINIMYRNSNKEDTDKIYRELFENYKNSKYEYDTCGFILGTTKIEAIEGTKGSSTMLLFISIYIGIIFLISSIAVLGLQQLSEASDSIKRYESLKKIGADKKSIDKTIFVQTLMYFSIPVGLALVHSVVGIKVVNNYISKYSETNILSASLITLSLFLIIYICYFFATYYGYKNIVKSKIK